MPKFYIAVVAIEGEVADRPNYQETEIDITRVLQDAIDNGDIRGITSADKILVSPSKCGKEEDYERASQNLFPRG